MKTILSAAILAALFAAPASAATGCMVVPEKALADAAKTLGQVPTWRGDGESGTGYYIILANPKTGQWTAAFIFSGEGKACVMAQGFKSEAAFGEPM